jgi:hypothetical protein
MNPLVIAVILALVLNIACMLWFVYAHNMMLREEEEWEEEDHDIMDSAAGERRNSSSERGRLP